MCMHACGSRYQPLAYPMCKLLLHIVHSLTLQQIGCLFVILLFCLCFVLFFSRLFNRLFITILTDVCAF
eukprot:m.386143 g.386143  ORF g.386143 m.386143 type:complete len:69 (-) comp144056_c0_seq1:57-263(-)